MPKHPPSTNIKTYRLNPVIYVEFYRATHVTLRYCDKTAKLILEICSLLDSPVMLFSPVNNLSMNISPIESNMRCDADMLHLLQLLDPDYGTVFHRT